MNYVSLVARIAAVLALFGVTRTAIGQNIGVSFSPFPYGDLDG